MFVDAEKQGEAHENLFCVNTAPSLRGAGFHIEI